MDLTVSTSSCYVRIKLVEFKIFLKLCTRAKSAACSHCIPLFIIELFRWDLELKRSNSPPFCFRCFHPGLSLASSPFWSCSFPLGRPLHWKMAGGDASHLLHPVPKAHAACGCLHVTQNQISLISLNPRLFPGASWSTERPVLSWFWPSCFLLFVYGL